MSWIDEVGTKNILDVNETINLLDKLVFCPLFLEGYKYFGNVLSPAVPMIISPPGWGKTSIIKEVGREVAKKFEKDKKYESVVIEVAIYSVGDLIGYGKLMPSPEEAKYTKFFPPEPFNKFFEESDNYLLIFLDELNRAKRDVLNQLLRLALEKVFAGRKLRSRSAIISAINPVATGAYVQEIPEALLERFFPIFGLKPDATEIYTYFHSLVGRYSQYSDFNDEDIKTKGWKSIKFGYGLVRDFIAFSILMSEGVLGTKKGVIVKEGGEEKLLTTDDCINRTMGELIDIGFSREDAETLAKDRFSDSIYKDSIEGLGVKGENLISLHKTIIDNITRARPESMLELRYQKHINPRNIEFCGRAISLWCFSDSINSFINTLINSCEAEIKFGKVSSIGVMFRGTIGSTEVLPKRPVGTQFMLWAYSVLKKGKEKEISMFSIPQRRIKSEKIGITGKINLKGESLFERIGK